MSTLMRRLAIVTVAVLGAALTIGSGIEAYGVGQMIGSHVRCASEDSPNCVRIDTGADGPADRFSVQVNGPDSTLLLIVVGG